MLKKILIGFAIFIAVLLLTMLLLPIAFKGKIEEKLRKEINNSINASVYFSADDFSLTFFRNFPNITVQLSNFGVAGINEFKGDTLADIKKFELELDIVSVIKGEKIQVKSIYLQEPTIEGLVLSDGRANWDIMKPDTTAPKEVEKPAEPTEFSLSIQSWEIENGNIIYIDKKGKTQAVILGLNHKGSGDFTQDIMDLSTRTTVKSLSFEQDSVSYLNQKAMEAELTMSLDFPKSTYTFKDNTFKINDFAFGFNGSIALPDTNTINTDITFATKETSFKTLLSLVPGVYTESFKDVKAEGNIAVDGFIKGALTDNSMPSFKLNMKVDKGMVQYPSLPSSITNIDIDFSAENKTAQLENSEINLRKLSMQIGKNPVNAVLSVKGLKRSEIMAKVNSKIDLAEISKAFPLEGLALQGLLGINLEANGIYDTLTKEMPKVVANFDMIDGYVKSKDFPAPLEKMNFKASVANATGKLQDTKVDVPTFSMLLEGEQLNAVAKVENFDDYTYDFKLKGSLDLAKLTKIYPLEGMTLAGKIKADIATKGKMSDIEAQRYDKLPTSGTLSMANFEYSAADLAHPVKISAADMVFNPSNIRLNNMQGSAGKTDFNLQGEVSNYLAYALKNETLKGKMVLKSTLVDANEWMSAEPATTQTTTPAPEMEAIAIPKNIDFSFASDINKVLYDNLSLTEVKGLILVKDGAINMNKLAFNTLDGNFVVSGKYDSKDINAPKAAFDLQIKNVAIAKAYEAFSIVKQLAPVAKNMDGKFSTNFNINTTLDKNMKPVFPTINGGGLVNVMQASVKSLFLVNGLNSLTKMNMPSAAQLGDLLLQATIENGRLNFKPFDVRLGSTKMNIGGSQSFDGGIDYLVKMDVPAGALGAAANSALSSITGKSLTGNSVALNIGVGGTMDKPSYRLLSAGGGSVKNEAKDLAKAKLNDVKERAQQQANEARAEAERRAREEAERLRKETEERLKAEAERTKNEAKRRLEEEAKKLKGRFKL